MRVIKARNVNDAWPQALDLLLNPSARVAPSRNGNVRSWPETVATVYARPYECVLMDPYRDVNPYLSLFESLWLLAGRDDATWLDQFVGDFSARFAEPDGRLHGSYGRRWRTWFKWCEHHGQAVGVEAEPDGYEAIDQLNTIVSLLHENKYDRQAVLQMWSTTDDLAVPGLKDRPCNLMCTFRADGDVLDMQVHCRSNDLVFGCMGSNIVQFATLQHYLAARIGIPVGIYTQISVNLHLYDWAMKHVCLRTAEASAETPYPGTLPMVTVPEAFDEDLYLFMDHTSPGYQGSLARGMDFKNEWFNTVAIPMFMANVRRRERDYPRALDWARHVAAPDWRAAAVAWLERRVARKREAA